MKKLPAISKFVFCSQSLEPKFNQYFFRLKVLADIDAFKLAREVAMNKLETFIYDKRDKLYQVCAFSDKSN